MKLSFICLLWVFSLFDHSLQNYWANLTGRFACPGNPEKAYFADFALYHEEYSFYQRKDKFLNHGNVAQDGTFRAQGPVFENGNVEKLYIDVKHTCCNEGVARCSMWKNMVGIPYTGNANGQANDLVSLDVGDVQLVQFKPI